MFSIFLLFVFVRGEIVCECNRYIYTYTSFIKFGRGFKNIGELVREHEWICPITWYRMYLLMLHIQRKLQIGKYFVPTCKWHGVYRFVKWMSCSVPPACWNTRITSLWRRILSFFMAWCDCCWFQASTLTQGRVPRHNETFGCEIQNLTECIKAKRTADAKGAVGLKWWLPISY